MLHITFFQRSSIFFYHLSFVAVHTVAQSGSYNGCGDSGTSIFPSRDRMGLSMNSFSSLLLFSILAPLKDRN